MATTSAAQKQLSDANSQGTILGQSITDLIGFYGVTSATAQLAVSSGTTQNSISSGALASTIAFYLNKIGLIQCTTISA